MKNIFTKTILILTILGLNYSDSKAQYVTIPDTNFVNWLTLNYPSCMNGYLMDTTCYEIVNAFEVDLGGQLNLPVFIPNLSGIQYFDNLENLWGSNANITTIPQLPASLSFLSCANNNITQLPLLPDGMIILDCSNNLISQLPTLPNSLTNLYCSNNLLSILPVMPNSLEILACTDNNLTYLFTNTNNLKELYCGNNPLNSALPILNDGLLFLYCENTGVTSLPNLPATLNILNCSGNPISILPALPTNLADLNCGNCNLNQIPTLPNNLNYLACQFNQLTSLPSLPSSLWSLFCPSNNISCFPPFPSSFNSPNSQIEISNNPFSCLPNYVSCMNMQTLAYPLCVIGDAVNNPQSCQSAVGITGKVIFDSISNCTIDSVEQGIKNTKINFFNVIDNSFSSVSSAFNGVYQYYVNPSINIVSIDTTAVPFIANCMIPSLDTIVTTTVAAPLANNVNFYLGCKPGLDLGVMSASPLYGIVFPGQQHALQVIAGDLSQWYGLNCSSGLAGTLSLNITGPVNYMGVPVGSLMPIVNGNNYSYTISDFGVVNITNSFLLNFTVDTTAQSGDLICINATITAANSDFEITNNYLNFCYTVVNSYDPNYKEVYPVNLESGSQDWLTYTIHFQNLGTATAFNINIKDTLDSNLNHQTFEVINYSHNNTSILQNGIVTFKFDNIMLPDSASNPSGSQGFVQYRIKPLANLAVGTQIENTAHIYFDFNPAVVTNTTVNNFTTAVGNATLKQATNLKIYPNPSTGIFTISSTANIDVYNIIGDLILSYNNATSIDLTAAPKGMYFVRLNGEKIEKLIKN